MNSATKNIEKYNGRWDFVTFKFRRYYAVYGRLFWEGLFWKELNWIQLNCRQATKKFRHTFGFFVRSFGYHLIRHCLRSSPISSLQYFVNALTFQIFRQCIVDGTQHQASDSGRMTLLEVFECCSSDLIVSCVLVGARCIWTEFAPSNRVLITFNLAALTHQVLTTCCVHSHLFFSTPFSFVAFIRAQWSAYRLCSCTL